MSAPRAALKFLLVTEWGIDPARSSSQLHVAQVLQRMLAAGHRVDYAVLFPPPRGVSPFVQELARQYASLKLLGRLADGAPAPGSDVLYLANLWSVPTLERALALLPALRRPPPAVTVLDTLDCLADSIAPLLPESDRPRMIEAEAKLRAAADLSVVISADERRRVLQRGGLGEDRVRVLGQAYAAYEPGFALGFEQRQHLCFVGTPHASNVQGLAFFLQSILPAVAEALPGVQCRVLGAGMRRLKLRVRKALAARVELVGYVPDLDAAVASHRVQVVPLLAGTGIKGKLLQSLACGTPVVATTPACTGLRITPGREASVADAPADFARAVAGLYRDPAAWREQQRHGRALIESDHAPRRLDAEFDELLQAIERVRASFPAPAAATGRS